MSDEDLVQHADDAYEAIRALNHGTYRTMPAPLVYDLLGNLRGVGHGLEQLARQLSAGLRRSLAEYDVYDHNRDPQASVELAEHALRQAATAANRLGELLSAAQLAINAQGYNLVPEQKTR
jgi:protein involved in polysaccharide export with SLBB domain